MAAFSSRVKLEGPVFRRGAIKKALKKARKRAMVDGIKEIKSWTPVRTGDLKRAWRYESDTIYNDMPYASFVENGTRFFEGYYMVRDAMPAIERQFGELVNEALKQEGLVD